MSRRIIHGFIRAFDGLSFTGTQGVKALSSDFDSGRSSGIITLANGKAYNVNAGNRATVVYPIQQTFIIAIHDVQTIPTIRAADFPLSLIEAKHGVQGELRVYAPNAVIPSLGEVFKTQAILDRIRKSGRGNMVESNGRIWDLFELTFQQMDEWEEVED